MMLYGAVGSGGSPIFRQTLSQCRRFAFCLVFTEVNQLVLAPVSSTGHIQTTQSQSDFDFSLRVHGLLSGLKDAHTNFYLPRNYAQFIFHQPLPLVSYQDSEGKLVISVAACFDPTLVQYYAEKGIDIQAYAGVGLGLMWGPGLGSQGKRHGHAIPPSTPGRSCLIAVLSHLSLMEHMRLESRLRMLVSATDTQTVSSALPNRLVFVSLHTALCAGATVEEIDGEPALDVLKNFAQKHTGTSKDLGTRLYVRARPLWFTHVLARKHCISMRTHAAARITFTAKRTKEHCRHVSVYAYTAEQ